MITLNPDAIGSLAPPSKLSYTSDISQPSGSSGNVPFRALSRIEKLRVQGKLVEELAEVVENGEDADQDEINKGESTARKETKEKKKTRGKNKTLKRYLRKKRKNVIDNNLVCGSPRSHFVLLFSCIVEFENQD